MRLHFIDHLRWVMILLVISRSRLPTDTVAEKHFITLSFLT